MIDSFYRKDKNYRPQVFLEKYKYVSKKNCPADSYYENSDKENCDDSNEENSDEKIQIKKTEFISLFLEKTDFCFPGFKSSPLKNVRTIFSYWFFFFFF